MFDLAFINDWLFNFFIIVFFSFYIFSVVDNLWQSVFGLTIFLSSFLFRIWSFIQFIQIYAH